MYQDPLDLRTDPQSAKDMLRLRVTRQLEHVLRRRQQDLAEAKQQWQSIRDDVVRRRAYVANIDRALTELRLTVHRQEPAVYANDGDLDRGTLTLHSEAVSYSGWRGDVTIPLAAIQAVELGTSNLPPRAGTPVLGDLLPGRRRRRETILLVVRSDEQPSSRIAALADLSDAAGWQEAIRERQGQLPDLTARRDDLLDQRRQAVDALGEATGAEDTYRARVEAIDDEIRRTETQVRDLAQHRG